MANSKNSSAIDPDIRELFPIKRFHENPYAILVGFTGVGKTTLFNKLCGTNYPAGEAKGSVTDRIAHHAVNCGNYSFNLIDTPGTDSSTDTYKHAYLLRQSITAVPICTIFIISKWNSRSDKIFEYYTQVQEAVYKYPHKIVVMVSYWDECKNRQKSYQDICEQFGNHCRNIIFYSEQSKPSKIAKLMYSCIANMEPEKLDIPDEEFFLHFNICQRSINETRDHLTKSFRDFDIETKKLILDYSNLLKDILSDKDEFTITYRDDMLQFLIIEFRNEITEKVDKFIKDYTGLVTEMHYFTLKIELDKISLQKCNEFVNLVVPHMSYSPCDSDDPRNMIRQCYYCGEIWFKTEGCNGKTSCGKVPEKVYDINEKRNEKPFYRFYICRENGKLKYRKQEKPKVLLNSTEKSENKKGKGCGREIIWSKCPKVDDAVIKELFNVQSIEQAKELIKNANFQDVKSNVDASFANFCF